MDWTQQFAAALLARLGREEAALELTPERARLLLDAAREVAHGTERSNAPLASYLVGAFIASRMDDGVDAEIAFEEALETLRRSLPAS
jgi:hypothetical protein